MPTPPGNTPEYTVSDLSGALKRTVETAFGLVRVRGEISGFKRHASGHLYFCLKDETAKLESVLWKQAAQRLAFRPEDGLEVIATGRLTTYPGRSQYQLVVERVEPAGEGALMALVEARKRALAAEGLFDPAAKRALPYLPERIGVITSPSGAVIRDILHRLAERFPRRVLVWPVTVQGPNAAAEIATALSGFCALPASDRPDVVVVARGGGSMEDLMPFNEESVVRAAHGCRIPLISAVGHETDTTLLDLAADRRAPTPTAAAEMAVPVRAELRVQVGGLGARLEESSLRHRERLRERQGGVAQRLPRPETLLTLRRQRADDIAERLPRALRLAAERGRVRSARAGAMLRPALAGRAAERAGERLATIRRALERAATSLPAVAKARLDAPAVRLRPTLLPERLTSARRTLAAAARPLETLNPLAVLRRGYAVVERPGGGVITTAGRARLELQLTVRFADGALPVTPATAPVAAVTRAKSRVMLAATPQETLF